MDEISLESSNEEDSNHSNDNTSPFEMVSDDVQEMRNLVQHFKIERVKMSEKLEELSETNAYLKWEMNEGVKNRCRLEERIRQLISQDRTNQEEETAPADNTEVSPTPSRLSEDAEQKLSEVTQKNQRLMEENEKLEKELFETMERKASMLSNTSSKNNSHDDEHTIQNSKQYESKECQTSMDSSPSSDIETTIQNCFKQLSEEVSDGEGVSRSPSDTTINFLKSAVNVQLLSKDEKIKELEEKCEEYVSEIENLRKEGRDGNEEEEVEIKEQRIQDSSEMEERYTKLKNLALKFKKRVGELETEVGELQEHMESVKCARLKAEQNVNTLQEEIDRLNDMNDELRGKCKRIKDDLECKISDDLKSKESLDKVNDEFKMCKKELNEMLETKNLISGELKQLKKIHALSDSQITNLNKQNEKFVFDNKQLNSEITTLKERCRKNDNSEKKLIKLRDINDNLESEVNELNKKMNNLNENYQSVLKSKELAQNQVREWKKSIESIRAQKDQLQKEVQSLQQVESRLRTVEEERDSLSKKLCESTRSLEENCFRSSQTLARAIMERDQFSKSHNQLNSKVSHLEYEMKMKDEKMDDMKIEIKTKLNEFDDLKKELKDEMNTFLNCLAINNLSNEEFKFLQINDDSIYSSPSSSLQQLLNLTLHKLKLLSENVDKCHEIEERMKIVENDKKDIENRYKQCEMNANNVCEQLKQLRDKNTDLEEELNSLKSLPMLSREMRTNDSNNSSKLSDSDFDDSMIHRLREELNEKETERATLSNMNAALNQQLQERSVGCERVQQQIQNAEYIKNIILKILTMQGQDEKLRLVPVLSTLLKLSDAEMQVLQSALRDDEVVESENVHSSHTLSSSGDSGGASGWTTFFGL